MTKEHKTSGKQAGHWVARDSASGKFIREGTTASYRMPNGKEVHVIERNSFERAVKAGAPSRVGKK